VIAQTHPSWEQIVVDDGSTDGTPDVMRRCADPRVRYVRREHRGIERLPETYNDLLSQCRAPLVAILEGDDYWPADKLATLLPAFDDPDVVLAYGTTEVVGDTRGIGTPTIPTPSFSRRFPPGALVNEPRGQAALAMMDPHALTFTYPVSVIVRRSALERIGGFQARPGLPVTDFPTFLRLCLEGRFHYEPRTMGYWRVHSAGYSRAAGASILPAVLDEIRRFRREHGARIPEPPGGWDAAEDAWRENLGWASLVDGRRRLLEGDAKTARQAMWRAVRFAPWRSRVLAVAAIVASFGGLSVEWVYRFSGRDWWRRSDGGVERVEVAGSPLPTADPARR